MGQGQSEVSNPDQSPKGTERQAGSEQAEWSKPGKQELEIDRSKGKTAVGLTDKTNWQQTNREHR